MAHEIAIYFTDTTVPNTIGIVLLWYRNFTTRRALAHMVSERLSDIGLTEAQRASEIAKPFWK